MIDSERKTHFHSVVKCWMLVPHLKRSLSEVRCHLNEKPNPRGQLIRRRSLAKESRKVTFVSVVVWCADVSFIDVVIRFGAEHNTSWTKLHQFKFSLIWNKLSHCNFFEDDTVHFHETRAILFGLIHTFGQKPCCRKLHCRLEAVVLSKVSDKISKVKCCKRKSVVHNICVMFERSNKFEMLTLFLTHIADFEVVDPIAIWALMFRLNGLLSWLCVGNMLPAFFVWQWNFPPKDSLGFFIIIDWSPRELQYFANCFIQLLNSSKFMHCNCSFTLKPKPFDSLTEWQDSVWTTLGLSTITWKWTEKKNLQEANHFDKPDLNLFYLRNSPHRLDRLLGHLLGHLLDHIPGH